MMNSWGEGRIIQEYSECCCNCIAISFVCGGANVAGHSSF